jgi:hypothetical protein
MKLLIIFFWLVTLYGSPVLSQPEVLRERLYLLPDLIFKSIEAPSGYVAAYELLIRQPVDHNNPRQGYFYQKAYLSHKGFDKPMVMVTEGYQCSRNTISELANMMDANQLEVEHRFFGVSRPDSPDYAFLTLKQAAADLHRINGMFRVLYQDKWISTGISKGGQTAIYYRYFYPEDVDVSVPYVAPFNLAVEDKRIYTFLDTIGTGECRDNIKSLQIRILKNREKVLPLLRFYAMGSSLGFTYLTLEEAFEYAVLEYPFSFWQWGYDCDDIPSDSVSLEESLIHLLEVSDIGFFSDRDILAFAPHYYQAAAEMGYYGYETADFTGLLEALSSKSNASAIFTPDKQKVRFNGTLAAEVYQWLKDHGDRFIYIYGGTDTWSATAVPPSDKVDAVWFFLAGKDHASARISHMNAGEKERLARTLSRWTGSDIPLPVDAGY